MRSSALLFALSISTAAFADDPKPVPHKAADSDAPLAQGFPGGTEPGTIEVKHYPAYRSAVATVEKATLSSGDLMFFALFNHIQKNDIAMTAPVINTYEDPEVIEQEGAKGEVTMEFVYREPDQGKTGKGGPMVEVKDHPAQDFVCLGVQGDLTDQEMRDGLAKLKAWLDEHKAEWTADGPPRRVGYHGPMTPEAQRLWEVQLPVKPAAK